MCGNFWGAVLDAVNWHMKVSQYCLLLASNAEGIRFGLTVELKKDWQLDK